MNEKSMIYWTFNAIEDDFNIESNETTMTTISTDITLTTTSLWTLKRWLMNFISNIQEKRARKNIHVNINSQEKKVMLRF